MLVNRIGNARDASRPDDKLIIEAWPQGDGAQLRVSDQDCGIDASIRDRLFEPFTTTKARGEGTGLGLPLVYSIIREHHGQIQIDSPPPGHQRGTRILVWLPRTQQDGEDPR